MIRLSLCVLALCPFVLASAACGGSDEAPPASATDAGLDSSTPDAAVTSPVPDAGSAADAAPDVDNGSPSTVYPAPHPAAPQVLENGGTPGGSVLAHAKIVPIFFSDYDANFETGAIDFVAKLGALESFVSTLTQYGVQDVTTGTPIILTEAAPIGTATAPYDDASIQTWLAGKLTSNDPQFGAADPSTVYTLFYPASTIISLGQDMTGQAQLSCQAFGGYHSDLDLAMTGGDAGSGDGGTTPIAYAVIPSCSDFAGLNGIDMITSAASHEIAEATTDPFPQEQNTGYSDVDQNHIVWDFVVGGGEIGDMCAQYMDAFFKPSGFDYYVQRLWSNSAAASGHNPCLPSDGPVYFNSAPVLPDMITLPFGGGLVTQGVDVPVGDSKTIELDLFSDGATSGPWTVTASEPTMGGAATLALYLDRSTGVNGEKLHLTITTMSANSYGLSAVLLTSTLGSQTAVWAALVKEK